MMFETERPLVSVIVPVYRVEPYLEKCITSITKQTYFNLDIILIDDGSPDRCGDICDRFALHDNRICVIHTENRGLSEARNRGIVKASGEYISFVDSDDYIEPEMIERLMEAARKTDAEIAVCNFVYEYENGYRQDGGKIYSDKEYQITEKKLLSGREMMQFMSKGKYAFCEIFCNKLFQRQLFAEEKFPAGKLHEDEYICHRLLYPCTKVALIPYIGYHYLQRKGSIMGRKDGNLHLIGAYLDRINYLFEREEKELALYNEGLLLSAVKRAEKENGNCELRRMKHEYFKLFFGMYRKKWVSFLSLCKRFVRCLII